MVNCAPKMVSGGIKVIANSSVDRDIVDNCDSGNNSSIGGACMSESDFKVNEDYARKFERNKKRQEKERLESKYKNELIRSEGGASEEHCISSSSYETEDENGFLATRDIDAQISATLHAIRSKDPRVYDKTVTFVSFSDDRNQNSDATRKQKPLFLKDYQRKRILSRDAEALDEEEEPPLTHAKDQEELQTAIVQQIQAVQEEAADSADEDELWQSKVGINVKVEEGRHTARHKALDSLKIDVGGAKGNPDLFLSKFMSSRVWIAERGGKWEAFESDDDDKEGVADEWEQAYNMRFEDPAKSNEVLKSYARDVVAQKSVRRKSKTSRQRQRNLDRVREEEKKLVKRKEKTRLRKLKLEESEMKLQKFRKAAGAIGKEPTEDEWLSFLDEAWDNSKWEEEMQKRFGEEYYAIDDVDTDEAEDDVTKSFSLEKEGATIGQPADKVIKGKKAYIRKPKWAEDIDVKDLIPDVEVEVGDCGRDWNRSNPVTNVLGGSDIELDGPPRKQGKMIEFNNARKDLQGRARQERSNLEALVDAKLELNSHTLLTSKRCAGFRYREASPQSFGLTARDILLAPSDKVLNDFAGLKKLASFRSEECKRRDRKRLGKKERLREWRRNVFGPDYERSGPTFGFEYLLSEVRTGQHGRASKANNIRASQSRTG